MELMKVENGKITSLELRDQINFFREKDSSKKYAVLQHKTLLEVIRDEFSEEIGEQNILPTSYTDKCNRQSVMFELTINQAKQVLVRESKVVRKAVIKRLDELENDIVVPSYQIDDPIARAKAWITEQEDHNNKIAMKDQIILECKTKVDYYDTILGSDGLLTITQIAKDYGLSGQALNKILNEEKIQYKQSGQWLLYDKHTRKGYTESETVPYFDKGVKKFKLNTKWKQKGRLMIHGLLENRGIKANMDQENV